jgi:hypothetical protein
MNKNELLKTLNAKLAELDPVLLDSFFCGSSESNAAYEQGYENGLLFALQMLSKLEDS